MILPAVTDALPAHPVPPLVAELRDVARRFGDRPALDGISLGLARGEIVGLIGRSGAGKSTLIRCLNGLDRPQAGRVIVAGQDITDLTEAQLQPLRRRVGMIFQHFNLLSSRTVAENVGLPLKIAGVPLARRRDRVAELLELVGLSDKAAAYPQRLSGGQKQRVGIARALATDPVLLLSDEATSALDPETTASILDLLQRLNRQLGLTILMITHEMEVVRRIAHRVAVLDAGRIVEQGDVARVLLAPRHAVTESLIRGLVPELPADLRAALVQPGQGTEPILQLDLVGDLARAPVLAWVQAATGQAPRLVHGGLSDVQGRPFGRLFLALGPLDQARLAAVLARLHNENLDAKVVGHVRTTH